MAVQEIRISTADGASLAADIHPAASKARGIVIINGAMAVPRRSYHEFATWLAEHGFNVITWNYRGMGDSGRAADCNDKLETWGCVDLDAVIHDVRQRWPGLPFALVAHSVGGQLLGLAPRAADAAAIVVVASQSGYWRLYRGATLLLVLPLWFLLIPLLTRIAGVFPARTFGIFPENIPARVARQWAGWARDPDYLQGRDRPAAADNFDAIKAPLLGIRIADDSYAPRPAFDAMLSWYRSAQVERLDVVPDDYGHARIGHFGLFRERIGREKLWPDILDWLDDKLPGRQE